ncbi:hypothetical protein ACIGEP_01930 [Microbacterium sp. NPDC077663]|uniref:hypothetical protein n=1 Tax=Microbacterium sp. NPDC077663 TaxID=3364189 RepID=UPI0037CA2C96
MIPRPVDARRVRVVRAGGAAAIATLTAAAAHTLGGGTAPAPWLVATVMLLAWPIALAIVGSRPSAVRTGLAVAASQALLHAAFALVGDVHPTLAAGHHHTALALTGAGGGAMPLDGTMLTGHAAAAIVTAAAVCHGERMLRVVARGIRALLRSHVPRLPAAQPRTAALHAATPRGLRPRLALTDLLRRGPPR